MNGDDKLRRLFDAARRAETETAQAQCGFEIRLLARLRAERERPAMWAAWTWRLTPLFGAIVAALGLWNCANPAAGGWEPEAVLAGDAEQALVAYFTGE